MARLLLDLGNTRLKAALCVDGRLRQFTACLHGNDIANNCQSLLTAYTGVDSVHIASVAGEQADRALTLLLLQQYGLTPRFHSAQARFGVVKNRYLHAGSLGVDRWLAIIAAHQRFVAHLCVVDCGSAITIDLIRADGNHMGGMIVPGLRLQLEALGSGLSAIDAEHSRLGAAAKPVSVQWGDDTRSCIRAGVMGGIIATVDSALARASASLGGQVELVLTGGDAQAIGDEIVSPYRLCEHLVLEGLAMASSQDGGNR